VAKLIGAEMDQGHTLHDSVKNVVEKKLMGTWKLAVLDVNQPDQIYFVKNSGDFIVGQINSNSLVVSTQENIFKES
jgi:glucosamine 6-phosphate synthetase-like amidotransferase/phosphosugar isomerase protein